MQGGAGTVSYSLFALLQSISSSGPGPLQEAESWQRWREAASQGIDLGPGTLDFSLQMELTITRLKLAGPGERCAQRDSVASSSSALLLNLTSWFNVLLQQVPPFKEIPRC